MSFIYGSPEAIQSPHTDPILELIYSSKANIFVSMSPKCLSLIDFSNGPNSLKCTLTPPANTTFVKSAFIDDYSMAILTSDNRLYQATFQPPKISDRYFEVSIPQSIIFFKKVGKHIFALTSSGTIFYISVTLTKARTRSLNLTSPIISAQASGDALFILLENGQLGCISQNSIEFFSTPTATKFSVDQNADYVYLCVPRKEWQLWSLKPLSFLSSIQIPFTNLVWSPVPSACVFIEDGSITSTFHSSIIEKHQVSSTPIEFASFDGFGHNLLLCSGQQLIHVEFACSSSPLSSSFSAPLTGSSVLIPFRESLTTIPLPPKVIGLFSIFGENSLAIATTNGFCALQFHGKISSSISDGTSQAQFVKNNSIFEGISEKSPNWLIYDEVSVKALAWFDKLLVALCFKTEYFIEVFHFSEKSIEVSFQFPLKGRPICISVNGSVLLVGYSSHVSFYSLEAQGSHISTISFPDMTLKKAFFLNSETIGVHLKDRRLLILFRSKVLKVFEDISAFQLTGSNAWPLITFGSQWSLIGANNIQLFLDDDMKKGMIIGIDGFSLFSLCPFTKFDFVHLVVQQSLQMDSLASAISILSQSTDQRKEKILVKVGLGSFSFFDRFMKLIERFSGLEDSILSQIFEISPPPVDPKQFWRNCMAHGWYRTASGLLSVATEEECVELIVASQFDCQILKKSDITHAQLFEKNSDVYKSSPQKVRLDEELSNLMRSLFSRGDFIKIAGLIPSLSHELRKFLFRTRRERDGNERLSELIPNLKLCSKQQLTDLSSVFCDTLSYGPLFCCSYCLNNFTVCIECLEKQPRITSQVSPTMLSSIGFSRQ